MVSFSESPEGYDSIPMATYLHSQVYTCLRLLCWCIAKNNSGCVCVCVQLRHCMALEEKLKTLDQQMAMDTRYLTRVSLLPSSQL